MSEMNLKKARPSNAEPLVRILTKDFVGTGMLWFVNRILHAFGFQLSYDADPTTGALSDFYVCRTIYRGFGDAIEDEGYQNVAEYLSTTAPSLFSEIQDIDIFEKKE